MNSKSIAVRVGIAAAVAAVAAAGVPVGVGSVATPVQPVVFAAPLPQAPADDVPSADQLVGVLAGLADPGVPFAQKSGLVEGGISPQEASMADHKMAKAERKGQLPLAFSVAGIQPAGPGAANADVTVSGPKLAPTVTNLSFVDQQGWKLSRASVLTLLQTV